MSRVYCYVFRSARGAALAGLTLADGREVRSWKPASSPSSDADADVLAQAVADGAQWVAQQLSGAFAPAGGASKRGRDNKNGRDEGPALMVCLDVDGARCAWLTAFGGDQSAVRAAVDDAAAERIEEGASGNAGGALWNSAEGERGSDLSVQGLMTAGAPVATLALPLTGRKGGPDANERRRLAVLAVPDLAARLFLDELDALGIAPEAVTSIWHAAALAWDPARAGELARGVMVPEPGDAPELQSAAPVSAVVLIDPAGRLMWTWSRGGALIAAGAQRLRRTEDAAPARADGAPGAESWLVEVSRSEVGRVINEWLAWSIQVNSAPQSIVVLGPGAVVCAGLRADLPETMGVAAVSQALAAAWPGATATASVQEDPIGATLGRLAQAAGDAGAPAPDDPQGALLDLSSRPGRASRWSYAWVAAAVAAAAVGVGLLGYKLQESAQSAEEQIAGLQKRREEAVATIKDVVPNASTPGLDQVAVLNSKLNELARQRQTLTPERPVLPAFARLVAAAALVPDAKLKQGIRVNFSGVTADFVAPSDKADVLPEILIALRAQPAAGLPIVWEGNPKTTRGDAERTYEIRGRWDDTVLKPDPTKPGQKAADATGARSEEIAGEGAKSEPKAEGKPDAKTEPKPENKPAKPEVKPRPKADPKPPGSPSTPPGSKPAPGKAGGPTPIKPVVPGKPDSAKPGGEGNQ